MELPRTNTLRKSNTRVFLREKLKMCVCPGKRNVFGWKIRFLVENGKVQSRLPKNGPRSGKIITLEFLEKNQILLFLNEFQRYDFPAPGPFFWQSTLNLAIFRRKMNFETKTLHFRGKHTFLPQICAKPIVSFEDLSFLKKLRFPTKLHL